MPDTKISLGALVPSETETLPLIAPAATGVAEIEIVQVAVGARVIPEHPEAVIPAPLTETVIGPDAWVPALETVTIFGVALLPTSIDPRSTDGSLTVSIAPAVVPPFPSTETSDGLSALRVSVGWAASIATAGVWVVPPTPPVSPAPVPPTPPVSPARPPPALVHSTPELVEV
jgi:hypothetical protein